MTDFDILYKLEKIHGIKLTTETIDGIIYVSVECKYWIKKMHLFPTGHNAEDFSEFQAKCYFIPQVLKMAGLRIEETLV